MESWTIVDSVEDVEAAARSLGSGAQESAFLATAPAPLHLLQRQGATVRGLHEFVSDEELNELALKNFSDSEEAVRLLSATWRELAPPSADGYDPFEATLFLMKRAADSATFRLKELLSFYDAVHPGRIAFVDTRGRRGLGIGQYRHQDTRTVLFDPGESVTAWLSNHGAWPDSVELQHIPRVEGGAARRVGLPTLLKVALTHLLNRNRLLGIRFLRETESLKRRRDDSRRLLVVSGDTSAVNFARYAWREMDALVDWWTQMDSRPVALPTLGSVDVPLAKPARLPGKEELEAVLEGMEGGPLWNVDGNLAAQRVMMARLRYFLGHRLEYLVDLYSRACRYLEERHPLAVLSGEASSDVSHTISQAASRYHVPFVVFQHGGCYGYCYLPTLNYSDLRSSHIFASWGTGVSSDMAEQVAPMGREVRFVDIGWQHGSDHPMPPSPESDEAGQGRAGMEAEGARVLYVTTGLHGNQRYGPYHSHDDTRYVMQQVDIVDALRRIPSVQIVAKTHYKGHAANPLARYVEEAGYDNVRVIQQGPMVNLLGLADVVVIDYASTTLLQALAAGKPVVLLNSGVHRYTGQGEQALRESTEWVVKGEGWQDELARAVVRALKRGGQPQESRLLREYGDSRYHPERLWEAIQDYARPAKDGVTR